MPAPYANLLLEKHDKVLVVKFNNPRKRNAMDSSTYADLVEIFDDAAKDDSVTVVVLTGAGDIYSSGNDITGSISRGSAGSEDLEEILRKSREMMDRFIRSFFNFPKLLVAVINGPAIGIAATTAALCDVIYCSEKAYFLTPFTKLGLRPEGCSTYTFPRILGISKANELLLLNHQMSAEEAYRFHFVSEVYKPEEFHTKIWPKIVQYSNLMPETFVQCKALVKKFSNEELERVLQAEGKALNDAWHSNDFYTAAMGFMSRKSKL